MDAISQDKNPAAAFPRPERNTNLMTALPKMPEGKSAKFAHARIALRIQINRPRQALEQG